jgi:tetraprenyl-beta-curcumene synthase
MLAFARTASSHLLGTLPTLRSELGRWRSAAEAIPDGDLRRLALASLAKRGNIEGAALFATLAPTTQRQHTVQALIAYQAAYNYLDTLAEQASADPQANARSLHEALLTPFSPGGEHADYYAHNPQREDGGYLVGCIDACIQALEALPSHRAICGRAFAAARRIVGFQSANLNERQSGQARLKEWAERATPAGSALRWWETAAAAGSSLAVHALIAAAATPELSPHEIAAIEETYWPWGGALHSLLDSVVDREEDRASGQQSLLDNYGTQHDAAGRLAGLAQGALCASERPEEREAHRAILTAMCSYYLSAPQCDATEAAMVGEALRGEFGASLWISVAMFRMRRAAGALSRHRYI